jgi:hypothetical protein
MRHVFAAIYPTVLLLVGAAAHAQQPAALTPTRDVDVTYRLAGPVGAPTAEQRVRWDVADGRQRIDTPTPGLHIIVDSHTHHLASVRDAEKLALEFDQSGMMPPPGTVTTYAKRGDATVAGLPCTVWQLPVADSPQMCLTDDGVLLRVQSGDRVVAEATRVVFGPSNPADFAIPLDYRRIVRTQSAKDPGQ